MTGGVIRRGQVYALAAMMIWSTNYVLGRALRDAVTPATISGFRSVVASALLAGWLLASRERRRAAHDTGAAGRGGLRALGVPFLLLGFLGIFCSQYMTYLALHWSLATNATILNAASPIVSATIAVAAGVTPASRGLFGGMAVSGTGAAILTILSAAPGGGMAVDPGALLIIASMVTWAFYNLGVQRLSRTVPPTVITMGAMLAGIPFLLAALAVEHPPHLLAAVRANLPALLWLAVGPSAAAYICWNSAVRDVGATHAMAFNNALPLIGMILGSTILHERVSAVHFLASALVIGGILITVRSQTGVLVMDLPEAPPPRAERSAGRAP